MGNGCFKKKEGRVVDKALIDYVSLPNECFGRLFQEFLPTSKV